MDHVKTNIGSQAENISQHSGTLSSRSEKPGPYPGYDADNISFLDILTVIVQRKRTVIGTTALCMVIATIVVFTLPATFTTEIKLLPQQQNQSSVSSMLGQLGQLGSLASLTTGRDFNTKNSSDIFVDMLQSQTLADNLILRFDLLNVYDEKYMVDARKVLSKRTTIIAAKDGVITIAVDDHDPIRAVQIVNGYVEELLLLNRSIQISEASQKRRFYETELQKTKAELTSAEIGLKTTQEKTGLIQLESQAKSIIEGAAKLKGAIAAKEVEIQSLQTFATGNNPQLIRSQRELTALNDQLTKIEKGQFRGKGDILVPTSDVPTAGLEYLRKLRDTKYYETVYEVLARQYEIARIDEGRAATDMIHVLDKAMVPEKRSKPIRGLIILLVASVGFLLSVLWVFLLEYFDRLKNDPMTITRYQAMVSNLKWK